MFQLLSTEGLRNAIMKEVDFYQQRSKPISFVFTPVNQSDTDKTLTSDQASALTSQLQHTTPPVTSQLQQTNIVAPARSQLTHMISSSQKKQELHALGEANGRYETETLVGVDLRPTVEVSHTLRPTVEVPNTPAEVEMLSAKLQETLDISKKPEEMTAKERLKQVLLSSAHKKSKGKLNLV